MPSCSFSGCTNSSKTKSKSEGDITFHSIPGDELLRSKWLVVIRKQRKESDWIPTNNSRICSIHFRTEDMYMTNKGYRKLYKCAVPCFEVDMETVNISNYSRSRSGSPNSLDNVNISDLESITESPRKAFLKKKLSEATMRNRRLVQDNINLTKKNQRLIVLCKNLKKTVAQLKKKVNKIE